MKKILIAEDDANILISLDFLMRKQGYQVYVARDGAEAWKIAKDETPDAVILDIMMPEMDGFQLCEKIKSTPATAHAKVVFLSAKGKEEDIQRGIELGASAYITKPFSTKELVNKIKEVAPL